MRSEARDQSGFTLLETMISLLILGGVVSVVMLHIASGQKALKRSIEVTMALGEAESLVNRIGLDIPARQGVWSGQASSGLFWVVTITPFMSEGRPIADLLEVQVRVDASSASPVTLSGLRRGR